MTSQRSSSSAQLHGAFVDFHIFFRFALPGKVFGHAVLHQLAPARLIFVRLQSFLETGPKLEAAVALELEAGSFASHGVPFLDGVVETAGGAHYGNGPIFEAVNLIQTTRLVVRGHEEDVCARFNL